MPAGLSVTPAETTHNPTVVTVKDLGNVPVHVTTSDLTLHAHCVMVTTAGITVSPASFTLKPGQTRHVTVHTPSARGDYGVLFSGHPVHPQPGVDIPVGAIGSQVLIGGASSCTHPPQAVAPVSHSLISLTGLVILAVIALGLGLATWAGILHRRNVNRRRNRRHA